MSPSSTAPASDPAIIKSLPPSHTLVSTIPHGTSLWSRTFVITTLSPTNTPTKFFLKIHSGPQSKTPITSQYHSDLSIHNTVPNFGVKPISYGQCLSTPDSWFLITTFHSFSPTAPYPKLFCEKLAALHKHSISPTGHFGFHVPAIQGRVIQKVAWNANWASFYDDLLSDLMTQEGEANGRWHELEAIYSQLQHIVIPRLLNALCANGRTIKPTLIHGDMWEANAGIDSATGEVRIFDSGAFYAHGEMELAMWREGRTRMGDEGAGYLEEYLRHVDVSEPIAEFEDRKILYGLKYLLVHSIHHPKDGERRRVYEDMCYLVRKYAPAAILVTISIDAALEGTKKKSVGRRRMLIEPLVLLDLTQWKDDLVVLPSPLVSPMGA